MNAEMSQAIIQKKMENQKEVAKGVEKIRGLNKDIHTAIRSADKKEVLGAQLRLLDYYGIDRRELSEHIIKVYGKDRFREIVNDKLKSIF
jgi:hypothetical protein